MSADPFRHAWWGLRLFLFAAWATLVVVWRRACYFGFPTGRELYHDEWQFMVVLVLLPGAVLLLGAPLARYAASFLCVLLLAAGIAEAAASRQERAFVARCSSTPGPTVVEQARFTIISGPRMLFLRSPDGTEVFHGYD